jgi:hypothetical protein
VGGGYEGWIRDHPVVVIAREDKEYYAGEENES